MQDKNNKCKIEGYWRHEAEEKSKLPWPIPTPGWGELEFLQKLRLVEQVSERICYRGFSSSRLTGEINGSQEYKRNDWRWPQGFGHYVKLGVKPSNDFIAFITSQASLLAEARK